MAFGPRHHLHDEVTLIEPVLARAGSPLALVGHSYGAAVALIAALGNPGRVRAMALYEPTLFALLDAEMPPPNEAEGIREVVAHAALAIAAGNQDAAAERFIDYWTGTGSVGADSGPAQAAYRRGGGERAAMGRMRCSPSRHR